MTSERLVASVEGDIAEVEDVLRITVIRLHFQLVADQSIDRDAVDRVLETFSAKCPAYQSVRGCIDCSWDLEIITGD